MRGVGVRGRSRDGRARIGEQPLDQRDRARRGGDKLPRPQTETQPELQHVECRIDMAPLGKLVAPRGIELRAAQLLGVFRRKRQPDARRSAIPAGGASASIAGARDVETRVNMPAGPSIMTSRTSCSVSPTSAMLRQHWPAIGARAAGPTPAPIPHPVSSCRRRVRPASARSSMAARHWQTRRLLVPMGERRRSQSSEPDPSGSGVSGRSSSASSDPARDDCVNAARKFITEFIDIGWHVIVWSIGGNGALQALQLLQRVGKRGQSAGRTFGCNPALRFVLQAVPQRLDHGELVEHRTPQAGDKVAFGFAAGAVRLRGPSRAPRQEPGCKVSRRRSRSSVSTKIRVAGETSRGGGT